MNCQSAIVPGVTKYYCLIFVVQDVVSGGLKDPKK